MTIQSVGILGLGAVGGMIFDFLNKEYHSSLYVLADGNRAERLKKEGITINGQRYDINVLDSSNKDVKLDLIIFCVKNYDLEKAIEYLKPYVYPKTIILPLLNGVCATEIIMKYFPYNKVLYGLIVKTDATRLPEHKIQYALSGEIQFGFATNNPISNAVKEIQDYLSNTGLNVTVFSDMRRMIWKKWMLNIGANQVSAITGGNYLHFQVVPEIRELLELAMNEILRIAKAEGIILTTEDRDETIQYLTTFPLPKKTSMLQDVEAKRRTEIDDMGGMVRQYSRKWNIPTPVNDTLFLSIKAKESIYLMDML